MTEQLWMTLWDAAMQNDKANCVMLEAEGMAIKAKANGYSAHAQCLAKVLSKYDAATRAYFASHGFSA